MGNESHKEEDIAPTPASRSGPRLNGAAVQELAAPSLTTGSASGDRAAAPERAAPAQSEAAPGRPKPAGSDHGAYWRANIRIVLILLAIWALVSYGFGVWLREPLDAFSIGGAPLGFWFAQQGAIYVFVALIFTYVFLLGRLDKKHGVDAGSSSPSSQK